MKNIANADRPKSVGAMLPPRPFRGSGKVAQTACNSDRREGKSCIPTLNQTFADSRILKISKFHTFRIAAFHRGVMGGNQLPRDHAWLPLAIFGPGRYPVIMGRIAMPSLIAQAVGPAIGPLLLKTGGL